MQPDPLAHGFPIAMVNLRKIGMPACEDISFLVSQTQDRSICFAERMKIRMHLAICRKCTRFGRQIQILRAAVKRDKQ